MPLKVELKPDERLFVGRAVIRNGDQKVRLFIEGDAPILREKDIMTPDMADTTAKRIYLAVQSIYLGRDIEANRTLYQRLVADLQAEAPAVAAFVSDINNRILSGDLYKALKAIKRLMALELELTNDAVRRERLR